MKNFVLYRQKQQKNSNFAGMCLPVKQENNYML